MEMKIEYSSIQFEDTVEFIATNNKHFLGKHEEIRRSLLDTMRVLARDHSVRSRGTMGFIILADRTREGFSADQDSCFFEFYVDPSLARKFDEYSYVEQIIDV